jgi:diguanylate cyclase (GGDEF)-like protein
LSSFALEKVNPHSYTGLVDDESDTDLTTAITKLDGSHDLQTQRLAVLLVMTGPSTGQTIHLETKDHWVIGRGTGCDIVLQENSVSRQHCDVVFDPKGHWIVKDLNSSNGTWVNGQKVSRHALESGDKIQLGSSIIVKFVLQDELEAAFQKELYESATRDSLTGLCSKRFLIEQLDVEFNFHRRTKKPLSVIMCDIDFFKKINDTYGHLGGDQVLKELGQQISQILRKGDLAGRYGGEEIIFLLRETPLTGALVFAERVRKLVESHSVFYEGQKISVTVSMGLATALQDNYPSADLLIKAADELLYKAKQAGRNRVVCPTSEG